MIKLRVRARMGGQANSSVWAALNQQGHSGLSNAFLKVLPLWPNANMGFKTE